MPSLRRNPIADRIRAAVTRTRGVCGSRPCIAGTRIHIEICIIRPFMAGEPIAKIHEAYMHLTLEQIEDAIRWWHYFGATWRKVPVQRWKATQSQAARRSAATDRAFAAVLRARKVGRAGNG